MAGPSNRGRQTIFAQGFKHRSFASTLPQSFELLDAITTAR